MKSIKPWRPKQTLPSTAKPYRRRVPLDPPVAFVIVEGVCDCPVARWQPMDVFGLDGSTLMHQVCGRCRRRLARGLVEALDSPAWRAVATGCSGSSEQSGWHQRHWGKRCANA